MFRNSHTNTTENICLFLTNKQTKTARRNTDNWWPHPQTTVDPNDDDHRRTQRHTKKCGMKFLVGHNYRRQFIGAQSKIRSKKTKANKQISVFIGMFALIVQ